MSRVVFITGCSRGIGLAAAVAFARRGDTVIATMRNPADSESVRRAFEDAGVAADSWEIVPLDVTDTDRVNQVITDVLDRHGRIDVLVNNAGIGHKGTLEELSLNDFERSLDANFLGCVRTMKAVLPGMRERGDGRIINVSSVAGQIGQPFNDAYCASKHALEGLVESMIPVVRPFGVHVSVLQPGPVPTEFFDRSLGIKAADVSGPYAAARKAYDAMMAGTMGSSNAVPAEELAAAIVSLADDPNPPARVQAPEWIAKLVGQKLKDISGERVVAFTSKWLEVS